MFENKIIKNLKVVRILLAFEKFKQKQRIKSNDQNSDDDNVKRLSRQSFQNSVLFKLIKIKKRDVRVSRKWYKKFH